MSQTTAAIVPVGMVWSFDEGYHYVGPFGSVPEANEWGSSRMTTDSSGIASWSTRHCRWRTPTQDCSPGYSHRGISGVGSRHGRAGAGSTVKEKSGGSQT
jgi:hypothetical protein